MQIDRGLVMFDYLGDGRFELLPPVDEADILRSPRSFVMLTAQNRIPLRLEPKTCMLLDATLPLAIEMSIPTSEGRVVYSGCCLLQE